MDKHHTFQTAHPTCPHCGHELDDDEMLYGKPTCDEDLYALAPNEGSALGRPRERPGRRLVVLHA